MQKVLSFKFVMNNKDVWTSDAIDITGDIHLRGEISYMQGFIDDSSKYIQITMLDRIMFLLKDNISSIEIVTGEIDLDLFKNLKTTK